jgi:hypothetical protein
MFPFDPFFLNLMVVVEPCVFADTTTARADGTHSIEETE